MTSFNSAQTVCFGEILFDMMPSGRQPGGAPMNVAMHLQKLGMPTAMISRVGNDQYGKELLDFLKNQKISTQFVQLDENEKTGVVEVTFDDHNEPQYTIVEGVAWDFIDDSFLEDENFQADWIVHGSLSCRSERSRNSLFKLLDSTLAKVVFDLNIRSPYYSKILIENLMRTAHIVKMNEVEFEIIKHWYHITEKKEKDSIRILNSLFDNMELLMITKGQEGATAWYEGEIINISSIPVKTKNTVGCGDAFLGAFLSQYSQGVEVTEALHFAASTGAFVATQPGATPEYDEKQIINFLKSDKQ